MEQGTAPDTLYLLEHPPTITLGRNTHARNLLGSELELARAGIALQQTDRGGDVTYHGPGQMVAYPIMDLRRWKCSIGWYLRSLEDIVIQTLAVYGVTGSRIAGYTGVWVDDVKVAAIGVALRNWVAYHGAALNVEPDMNHFGYIVPCGITDKKVGCLSDFVSDVPPVSHVMEQFKRRFLDFFASVQ